jgi:rubrerythrin
MTPVSRQILDALSAGIKSEVASYVFYTAAAKKTQSAAFRPLLEKLAHEEKDHFHVLERQYDSLNRSEKWISTADILKMAGLPEITEDMSLVHRALLDELAKSTTAKQVLDIAYRLEKEAHDLFDGQAKITESAEGKKMFEQLAKFEAGHMRMISEMMANYA